MASALSAEQFWVNKSHFATAERQYYEILGKFKETEIKKNVECSEGRIVIDCPSSTTSATRVAKPDKKESKVTKPNADLPALKKPCENEKPELVVETPKSNKKNKKKNKGYNKKHGGAGELKDTTPTTEVTAVATVVAAKTPQVSNDKIVKQNTGQKTKGTVSNSQSTLVSEIAKAREHIKNSLEKMDGIASLAASPVNSDVLDRLNAVEKENANLKNLVEKLNSLYLDSQKRLSALESQLGGKPAASAAPAAAAVPQKSDADDDDGVDLFASDDEEESAEAAKIREERLAAYAAKKSKKPALIAKSSLVLDVKPWDDETDLKLMEAEIRKITCDGLLWGASKFVPVAFGIQKLSISCVVEDEKVSIDWLTEEIEKNEDFVQSVDVAAFNKI